VNAKYIVECYTGVYWDEESRFYLYDSALEYFNKRRYENGRNLYRIIEIHMES